LLWRLKVVGGAANHRVFFDMEQDPLHIRVLGVRHRDDAYDWVDTREFESRFDR
jgi:hypothetical protein